MHLGLLCDELTLDYQASELVRTLRSLQAHGVVELRHDEIVTSPQDPELVQLLDCAHRTHDRAALRTLRRWTYQLTNRGGRLWSRFHQPLWRNYFRLTFRPPRPDVPARLRFVAVRRELVDRFEQVLWSLGLLGPHARAERCVLSSFPVAPWKTVARAYALDCDGDIESVSRAGLKTHELESQLGISSWLDARRGARGA